MWELQWGIPEYNALTDVHSSEVARRLLGNKQAVKRLRKAGIVSVAANPSPRPHTRNTTDMCALRCRFASPSLASSSSHPSPAASLRSLASCRRSVFHQPHCLHFWGTVGSLTPLLCAYMVARNKLGKTRDASKRRGSLHAVAWSALDATAPQAKGRNP